jgi:hypothetical protein
MTEAITNEAMPSVSASVLGTARRMNTATYALESLNDGELQIVLHNVLAARFKIDTRQAATILMSMAKDLEKLWFDERRAK